MIWLCHECLQCMTRGVGMVVKPSLSPIQVAGLLDKIGIDVLQLSKTYRGYNHNYFLHRLSNKMAGSFATPDQI